MWVKGSKVHKVYARHASARGQVGDEKLAGSKTWAPPGGWKGANKGAVNENTATIEAAKATTTSAIKTIRIMNSQSRSSQVGAVESADTATVPQAVPQRKKRVRIPTSKAAAVEESRQEKRAKIDEQGLKGKAKTRAGTKGMAKDEGVSTEAGAGRQARGHVDQLGGTRST